MGGFACKIKHLSNSDFHVAKPFYFTNPCIINVLSGAKTQFSMLLRGVPTFSTKNRHFLHVKKDPLFPLPGQFRLIFLVQAILIDLFTKLGRAYFTFVLGKIQRNVEF